MNLRFSGEFCIMTMRNGTKFEDEFTCQFKTDVRSLTNFEPSSQKFHKLSVKCAAFDQSI